LSPLLGALWIQFFLSVGANDLKAAARLQSDFSIVAKLVPIEQIKLAMPKMF
jgi:hypothetical protein